MLNVEDLHFGYMSREVLKGISFEAGAGVLFLIGPNGAGKTTLAHVIAGIYRPWRGRVLVDGVDVHARHENKVLVAIARQQPPLPLSNVESPLEYLRIYCELRGDDPSRAAEVLELLGVPPERKDLLFFSPGMKKKVEIAKLMLAESARVLIVDELAGLDAQARRVAVSFLREAGRSRCVIVITHNPLDIQELRGRVAVMMDGRITATTTTTRRWPASPSAGTCSSSRTGARPAGSGPRSSATRSGAPSSGARGSRSSRPWWRRSTSSSSSASWRSPASC
jgi:ABC-type multidrug transport system ATPase subunit